MSWIGTILSALAAIPKIIDAFREMWWSWETSKGIRREQQIVKDNNQIHDEIAGGGRPTWDDRK